MQFTCQKITLLFFGWDSWQKVLRRKWILVLSELDRKQGLKFSAHDRELGLQGFFENDLFTICLHFMLHRIRLAKRFHLNQIKGSFTSCLQFAYNFVDFS